MTIIVNSFKEASLKEIHGDVKCHLTLNTIYSVVSIGILMATYQPINCIATCHIQVKIR
jgi:hypothetical protein